MGGQHYAMAALSPPSLQERERERERERCWEGLGVGLERYEKPCQTPAPPAHTESVHRSHLLSWSHNHNSAGGGWPLSVEMNDKTAMEMSDDRKCYETSKQKE